MKFTFRKLSALLLALLLVCALCANAFAAHEYCAEDFEAETYGSARVECGVHSCKDQAWGYISLSADTDEDLGTITCIGNMSFSYVYCREDMVKPSNFVSRTQSANFNLHRTNRTKELNSGVIAPFSSYVDNVMLEATMNCVMDITTPNSTTNYGPNTFAAYYY